MLYRLTIKDKESILIFLLGGPKTANDKDQLVKLITNVFSKIKILQCRSMAMTIPRFKGIKQSVVAESIFTVVKNGNFSMLKVIRFVGEEETRLGIFKNLNKILISMTYYLKPKVTSFYYI